MAKQNSDLTKNNEIISFPIDDLMEDRFGRYAKYIIQDRALPDVRDGLKPVQRRILYGMSELKIFYNKPTLKSARIVGDVMGKYHPHGDSSIYEAMVRMSQDWKMGVPLVRMQGNNGSIDGDSAAAYRYTEAKLQKISELLLSDLDKDTVEFAPNYDDKLKEPTVLPAYFPNILVNGSTGIAAGYATNMPPHNLNEVVDVTIAYIKNPELTLKEAMKFLKGPDFPTGGIIQGVDGVKNAFHKGRGKVILNSKWHEEKHALIIDEIPYEVIKQDLVKDIGLVADENPGLEIKEVIDESGREHAIRIAIYLSAKANLEVVRKVLFKQTNLSISYNYNNVVIINKQPRQVGLLEILDSYVNHYVDVYQKKTKYNLNKALERLEIVEGLIKTMGNLDAVIKTIRASDNRGNAMTNLIQSYDFSQAQAQAIVDMQLYRLTSTDVVKLEQEQKELKGLIKEYKTLLKDDLALNQAIIDDLNQVKASYGRPRRSVIEKEVENLEVEIKDTIVEKILHLYLSRDGYLKAISNDVYGKNEIETFGRKPGDAWIYHQEVSNMDQLIAVSNQGNYYSIPLFKVGFSKWKDNGIHINEFASMGGEEVVLTAFCLHDFASSQGQLLLGTKQGLTKRVVLSDLETKSFNKGFRIMKLAQGDEVVSANLIASETKYVGVVSKTGYGVRYGLEDIPIQGLNSKGVKASSKDDLISGVVPLTPQEQVLFLTQQDSYQRLSQDQLPLYVRPKKGVKLFTPLKSKPEVISKVFNVNLDDELVLLNADDDIKALPIKATKVGQLGATATKLPIKQVVDAYVIAREMIDPHTKVLGSEEYVGEQTSSILVEPKTAKVKKTKKVTLETKQKVDSQLQEDIEKKVNSLGSSLLDDFDFGLTTKNNVDETQLNFDDLLADEDDNKV